MKGSKIIKLIFLIFLLVPTIFWIINIAAYSNGRKIQKNGIETNATVISRYSDFSVNDESYYALKYYFEVDGKTYYGKTSAEYLDYNSAQLVENNATIRIAYDPKTFDSVQVGAFDKPGTPIIILSVFFAVFLIVLISAIYDLILAFKKKQVLIHGIETDATFVSSACPYTVNGVSYYNIKYTYIGQDGKECKGKSKTIYTSNESNYFMEKGIFKIKYSGKISVISEKPDATYNSYQTHPLEAFKSLLAGNGNGITNMPQEETIKICEYCGSEVGDDETICPRCSGNEFKYIKKKPLNK